MTGTALIASGTTFAIGFGAFVVLSLVLIFFVIRFAIRLGRRNPKDRA